MHQSTSSKMEEKSRKQMEEKNKFCMYAKNDKILTTYGINMEPEKT